jgi:GNAT superfamily N-acetyltransferase
LPALPTSTVVDDPRFHLVVAASGEHATVGRLRADGVAGVFREVRERAPRARVVWVTDGGPEKELRALGCRDQDPPLTSYVTALATGSPPPGVEGVETQHLETYEQFLVAHRVSADGWGHPPSADPEAAWERRRQRAGGDWLAYVDGEPVAYAGAIAGPRGLFLTGGVTLPHARGRGAYRALVRARWDEAVRLGTPALVVHAEEASRRVLQTIGFERTGAVVELVSDPC